MLRKKRNGVQWLEFELLADFPRVKHAVFLKHGGTSCGPYESFNLSYGVGDDPSHVKSNLEKAANILDISHLVWGNQEHGVNIAEITSHAFSKVSCDALVTTQPGIGLLIHHADCQAAIFYDAIHHTIATVHSGWRGSVQNIYAKTITTMGQLFGSKPQDLLVCISPSLGPESAEFIHYQKELPQAFHPFQVKPNYFDFWAISEMQLKESGILPSHIQIARMDTFSNPADFYSYRYSKIRGGHGTIAALIE